MKYDKETAIAIGYHFWNCKDDDAAEQCGSDCARDIYKRLNQSVSQKKENENDTNSRWCVQNKK